MNPPLSSPKKASPLFHAFLHVGEIHESFMRANPDEESVSRTRQKISVPSW